MKHTVQTVTVVTTLSLMAIGLLLAQPAYAQLGSIGINFTGRDGGSSDTADVLNVELGTSAGTAAGVLGVTTPWNDILTNSTENTPQQVTGTMGASASVTWAANAATWSQSAADTRIVDAEDPNGDMKDGHIEGNAGHSATVTVSGLIDDYASYNVYVYMGDDAGDREGLLEFNGDGGTTFFSKIYDGTYTDGTDYMLFNDVSGDSFTVSVTSPDSDNRTGIHGIEIIGVTESIDTVPELIINRDTGNIRLVGGTVENTMAGYALLSDSGTLKSGNWNTVSDNYDEGTAGGISNDEWTVIASNTGELAEGTLGTGAVDGATTIDFGNVWLQSPTEDIELEILRPTGETETFAISYEGNGDEAFQVGDYNFDGNIDVSDWPAQRDNYTADLTGMSTAEGYRLGDFDMDGDNDIDDAIAFKAAFVAAGGNLSALTASVPEPTSLLLLSVAGVLAVCRRSAHSKLNGAMLLLAFVAVFSMSTQTSCAQSIGVSYAGDNAGGTSVQIAPEQVAGVVPQANWNAATGANGTLTGLVDNSGTATAAEVTWSTANTWGGTGASTDDEAMVNGWLDGGNLSTITNIPYNVYDVYVYGSSDDGNSARGWAITVNGTQHASEPGIFGDDLTANGSYFDGTYVDVATGNNAPSYALASGLTGDLTISGEFLTINGLDSRGVVSGFQIVPSVAIPQVLTLEINTETGVGIIKNNTGSPIDFDSYQISSDPSDSLNFTGWDSIQDNGPNGLPQGDGSGNGWEELGNNSDNHLAEFFLDGSSTLANGDSISLGNIFDTTSGVQEDLQFSFHNINTFNESGLITFVTGTDPGDFDGDGDVDGNDFLTWQRGAHSSSDLTDWENNFGSGTSGGSATTTAVPEPTSWLLLALGVILSSQISRRNYKEQRMVSVPSTIMARGLGMLAVTLLSVQVASATVDNDRRFSFDTGQEGASAGAIVGSGHSVSGALDALDEIGPSGSFLDLGQTGNTRYVNVFSGAHARAGTSSGNVGVIFDGVDDRLSGTPLNRPDELNDLTTTEYPHNYTNILGHGMQGWVYPSQAGINAGTFQSIMLDTVLTGGPAITADGKWSQSNSEHIGTLPGTVDVVGDQWYHMMYHNQPLSGDSFANALFVDGIAVSLNVDTISQIGDRLDYSFDLHFGAAEKADDEGYEFFFTGALDDIEMYVFGDNSDDGGKNYGTFDLFADNAWIQNEIDNDPNLNGTLEMGDVNRDGTVSGDGTGPAASDDVTAIIDGWRSEKVLVGAHSSDRIGDWETWGWGDLNTDGVVNFSDWHLLREAHPEGAALNLGGLLQARSVPEPTSVLLLMSGILGGLGCIRRR